MISVVIPVYNAQETLDETFGLVLSSISMEKEVILVDDASTDETPEIIDRLASTYPFVKAIQHSENRGAGAARNTGLAAVSGEFVLFFDADDILYEGVVDRIVEEMKTSDVDLAMTSYEYARGRTGARSGMHSKDGRMWNAILKGDSTRHISLMEHGSLLTFTNYPWNKVLRTAFAKAEGLYFSETAVNNDIHAHWQCLLFAKSILLVNEPICLHIVPEGGKNITNTMDRRRLTIFEALDDVENLFQDYPQLRTRFYHHFVNFKLMMARWARDRIPKEHLSEFHRLNSASFFSMGFSDYLMVKERMPGVAKDVRAIMLGKHPKFAA
ncbi:glycosyltransferase family 2 protein [Flexibacterium corallicola]|uniref:glycosyltransferase family 2 protein n=1 Tax=Flexibacterium corallicola TaxID=3037259 RepID=UPI00286F1E97|nr:glycosyltransferase family 2 protein [Pseudovibrio sp. M1P-2-3]